MYIRQLKKKHFFQISFIKQINYDSKYVYFSYIVNFIGGVDRGKHRPWTSYGQSWSHMVSPKPVHV